MRSGEIISHSCSDSGSGVITSCKQGGLRAGSGAAVFEVPNDEEGVGGVVCEAGRGMSGDIICWRAGSFVV